MIEAINAERYAVTVIRILRNRNVRILFEYGTRTGSLPADVQRRAVSKLQMLHAAQRLDDLNVPPGNRLEQIKGDRRGQHSVRVNDQYRVCFRWRDGDAHDSRGGYQRP